MNKTQAIKKLWKTATYIVDNGSQVSISNGQWLLWVDSDDWHSDLPRLTGKRDSKTEPFRAFGSDDIQPKFDAVMRVPNGDLVEDDSMLEPLLCEGSKLSVRECKAEDGMLVAPLRNGLGTVWIQTQYRDVFEALGLSFASPAGKRNDDMSTAAVMVVRGRRVVGTVMPVRQS